MSRFATIDMCRGLLFALMANTHALDLAGVDSAHWLRSDIWLPNGWATVVFVVLSGYGAGYIFSVRAPEGRNRALLRRGTEILAVMFASNFVFAILRQVAASDFSPISDAAWWLGFLTLDSEWTISGVLLPTSLVLLVAPWVIRWVQSAPWAILPLLLLARIVVAVITIGVRGTPGAETWLARFLLLEGFGGFPVLPFLLNGCLGIWLGILHQRRPELWKGALLVLLVFQAAVYLSTYLPSDPLFSAFRATVGAIGKFGWMFVVADLLARPTLRRLSAPVEQIGRFALGSFVMHRVFMQGLAIGLALACSAALPPVSGYVVLFGGTMLLTWLLCEIRERAQCVDASFRRMAL